MEDSALYFPRTKQQKKIAAPAMISNTVGQILSCFAIDYAFARPAAACPQPVLSASDARFLQRADSPLCSPRDFTQAALTRRILDLAGAVARLHFRRNPVC